MIDERNQSLVDDFDEDLADIERKARQAGKTARDLTNTAKDVKNLLDRRRRSSDGERSKVPDAEDDADNEMPGGEGSSGYDGANGNMQDDRISPRKEQPVSESTPDAKNRNYSGAGENGISGGEEQNIGKTEGGGGIETGKSKAAEDGAEKAAESGAAGAAAGVEAGAGAAEAGAGTASAAGAAGGSAAAAAGGGEAAAAGAGAAGIGCLPVVLIALAALIGLLFIAAATTHFLGNPFIEKQYDEAYDYNRKQNKKSE